MPEVTVQTEPTVTLDLPVGTDRGTPTTQTEPERKATNEPDKPAIDLKIWAKTSAEAREAKAKVAELEAKVAELTKINPDTETALNAKLLELLKQPGTARRLVTDGGRTFEDIVAELTDIPVDDPAVTATNKRLEVIEADRKAEKEQRDKDAAETERAKTARDIANGQAEIAAFATKNTETQADGTPRWAIVTDSSELIEEARASVVAYMQKHKENHPSGYGQDVIEKLVSQALDKLELRQRDRLKPILSKLSPVTATTNRAQETAESRITRTENPFESKPKPSTITNDLKGPMPTKTVKPRYSSGPRSIRYTD